MSTPAPMPTLTELKLTDAMKELVNGALMRGRPMVFTYVNDAGEPNVSLRGSLQAYSDTQLAIWVRNPAGGLLKAIEKHPAVAAMYVDMNPAGRAFLTFRGKGRVDASDAVRRAVYDNSPEVERNLDKERKGAALIIDLETVHGMFPGARAAMKR